MDSIRVMLDEGAFPLSKGYEADAGYDVRTPVECWARAHDTVTIDTGVHVEIPKGCAGFVKSKSGLYMKGDITADGLIDSGYTGSVRVKLVNHGERSYHFQAGDKIAQIVFLPICSPEITYVDSLDQTERGDNGFGSTGA